MSIIVGIFLDILLENNRYALNQTRLDQIKPYLNNPCYEVFVYVKNNINKSEQIYNELLNENSKFKEPFFSINQLVFFQEKKYVTEFLKHKAYLKQKTDSGNLAIILGTFTDKASSWVQDYELSLVAWPYNSPKTLEQLFSEQLELPSNIIPIRTDKSLVEKKVMLNLFPKRVTKRDIPCAREVEELLKSIQILRDDIKNLTEVNIKLEEEQLVLQLQMISSEKSQTRLLKELFTLFPLTLAETGMTVSLLIIHLLEAARFFKKCFNKYRDQTASKEVNERIQKVKASATTQTEGFFSSASTSLDSAGAEVSNLKEHNPLKNFAKKKHYTLLNGVNETSSFYKKKSDRHTALLQKGYVKSSEESLESLSTSGYHQMA